MTPELTRRDVLKLSGLSLLFLAGCRPQVATTLEDTPIPYPTTTHIPLLTDTETPSPTDTPEPSPTPEWLTADPNAKETWPSWAQEYFANPNTATDEEDRRFDQFLTDARRSFFERLGQSDPERFRTLLDYLVQGGVLTTASREDVAGMTQGNMLETLQAMYEADLTQGFLPRRHMLWMNLIERASKESTVITERSIILSPNEIRQITIDRDAYVEPWTGFLPGTSSEDWSQQSYYGFGGIIARASNTHPAFRGLVRDIFGKVISEDQVWISHYEFLSGDTAGLVELPRRSGFAMLTRVRNAQGEPFLHIFHLEEEGLVTESGSILCFGSLAPDSGHVGSYECPAELNGEVSQFIDWSQGGRPEWQTLTREAVQEWLMWPPARTDHEQVRLLPLGRTRVLEYIIHPSSHLIMALRLEFYPTNLFQNQP